MIFLVLFRAPHKPSWHNILFFRKKQEFLIVFKYYEEIKESNTFGITRILSPLWNNDDGHQKRNLTRVTIYQLSGWSSNRLWMLLISDNFSGLQPFGCRLVTKQQF